MCKLAILGSISYNVRSMKTLLIGLLFGFFTVGLFTIFLVTGFSKNDSVQEATSQKAEIFDTELSVKIENYAVYWLELQNISSLTLNPNYDEKLASSQILTEAECKSLINAGFYTEDGKPVGLFVSDGETLRKFSTNSLFNGVFYIKGNDFGIIDTNPKNPDYALQTGPILLEAGDVRNLSLNNDKSARRVVLATSEDSIVFLVFFDSESVYLGPYLDDLPQLVNDFSQQNNLDIIDAINLDGGSASAFITKDVALSELSPIGSYFCVR